MIISLSPSAGLKSLKRRSAYVVRVPFSPLRPRCCLQNDASLVVVLVARSLRRAGFQRYPELVVIRRVSFGPRGVCSPSVLLMVSQPSVLFWTQADVDGCFLNDLVVALNHLPLAPGRVAPNPLYDALVPSPFWVMSYIVAFHFPFCREGGHASAFCSVMSITGAPS